MQHKLIVFFLLFFNLQIANAIEEKLSKDIGIVFLPNQECKNFAEHITNESSKVLAGFLKAENHPHITAIHIANVKPTTHEELQKKFDEFVLNESKECIPLPITGIKATGGNDTEGFKWLDLQFDTPKELTDLRAKIVEQFCPFHDGILTRMNDDLQNFNSQQKNDIKKCGVTYSSYLPHITLWYIDLPKENKTLQLAELAKSFDQNKPEVQCYIDSIALVELGRNGNAHKILKEFKMCK
jgi:hypothetical protein